MRKIVALEIIEFEFFAALERSQGFHFLCDDFERKFLQSQGQVTQLFVRYAEQIDFDVSGELDQRLVLGRELRVMQREVEAQRFEPLHAFEQCRVGVDLARDFQHDAFGRQQFHELAGQHRFGDIEER